ncbi:hypothetical protein GB937_010026 [Aspergillus fischeri]|nr:hypothetical protein GB937_010026 [Aspergillus fischeri]
MVYRAWRKRDTSWPAKWESLGITSISSGITATEWEGSVYIAGKCSPEGAIGVYELSGKTFSLPGQYCVGTPTVFTDNTTHPNRPSIRTSGGLEYQQAVMGHSSAIPRIPESIIPSRLSEISCGLVDGAEFDFGLSGPLV